VIEGDHASMARAGLLILKTIALAAIPVVLIALAIPRFEAGLASTPARSVLRDRLFNYAVHPIRLARAEKALSRGAAGDGDNTLWRAELQALLARNDVHRLEDARSLAIEGLGENPASTRGWTLLCELDVVLKRADAGRCLDTAFFIGPFDWFVAQRRTALSVQLWASLDSDTQDAAARRLRLIWETPGLRFIDFDVAKNANGLVALGRAFDSDPEMKAALERQLKTGPLP
jgi:hypothetical protein